MVKPADKKSRQPKRTSISHLNPVTLDVADKQSLLDFLDILRADIENDQLLGVFMVGFNRARESRFFYTESCVEDLDRTIFSLRMAEHTLMDIAKECFSFYGEDDT